MKDLDTELLNRRPPCGVLPRAYWCPCSTWRTRVYAVGKMFVSGGRVKRLVKHYCQACDRKVHERLRTYPKHFPEAAADA